MNGEIGQQIGTEIALPDQPAAALPAAQPIAPVYAYFEENAELLIAPGTLTLQPGTGDVLINKDVYFVSSAATQTHNLTMLGHQVTVRMNPVSFTWSPGDGSLFSSTSPGGPWPDGDVTHTYVEPGIFTPSVTVDWDVFVNVSGLGFVEVDGDAQTTTTGNPLTVVEAEAVLTAKRGSGKN